MQRARRDQQRTTAHQYGPQRFRALAALVTPVSRSCPLRSIIEGEHQPPVTIPALILKCRAALPTESGCSIVLAR